MSPPSSGEWATTVDDDNADADDDNDVVGRPVRGGRVAGGGDRIRPNEGRHRRWSTIKMGQQEERWRKRNRMAKSEVARWALIHGGGGYPRMETV